MRSIALLLVMLLVGLIACPAGADVGDKLLDELKRGLRSKDVERRKEAVNDIGRHSGRLKTRQAHRAAITLRKALDEEEDADVRRLMIRALARMRSTHAWIQVVLTSQRDRPPFGAEGGAYGRALGRHGLPRHAEEDPRRGEERELPRGAVAAAPRPPQVRRDPDPAGRLPRQEPHRACRRSRVPRGHHGRGPRLRRRQVAPLARGLGGAAAEERRRPERPRRVATSRSRRPTSRAPSRPSSTVSLSPPRTSCSSWTSPARWGRGASSAPSASS